MEIAPDPIRDAAKAIAAEIVREEREGLRPRVPRATYRVQLHAGFNFRDTTAIVPYLNKLGIGALYVSPIFRAKPGSRHGYDVIDYGSLNPEIGSEEEFADLVAVLQENGMGLVLDFVPNHMGIGGATNPWWLDLIENGRGSQYATTFDVDWDPIKPELHGKVLIPVLGDHYGVVLENGELRLRFEAESGTFWLDYYDNPFPLAPATYPAILRQRLDELVLGLPPDDLELLEFQSIIGSLERLPEADDEDTEARGERAREQIVAKRRLADVVARSEPILAAIRATVDELNGDKGDPRSFDALDRVIEGQAFRLAFWRVAAEEINYRRFFAINDLAAIRQEEPAVFAATHGLLLRLLAEGSATGVRIDHPDGLWDPAGYMATLQREYRLARCRRRLDEMTALNAAGEPVVPWESVRDEIEPQFDESEDDDTQRALYLVVEKILEHGEELPADWEVHGTTGYDFANAVTALFVDPAGRKAFDDLYAAFMGEKVRFADMVYVCKHLIMRVALASEVAVLTTALDRITEHTRRSRDFTLNNLRDALREVIACFPVYRTYLVCNEPAPLDAAGLVSETDARSIDVAIREARKRNPAVDPTVYAFIRGVLLQQATDGLTGAQRAERGRFAMKFQQLTGPVMAKGLEDTAFYRYNRLTALNEVGGDPMQFGLTVAQFHRQNGERWRRWPHSMLASSTHDTKRAEDVRARLATLSEMPREWRTAVNRWTRFNRKHKTRVDGVPAPDRNDEYMLYQSILGAWPFDAGRESVGAQGQFVERIEAYVLKALREAQVHTNWINPSEEYEEAATRFVRAILDGSGSNPFLDDLETLRKKVSHCGALNALAMQLLKVTSPGVPDLYQGTELWDLSLVDPDNRRPVDYARREQMLDQMLTDARDRASLATELAGSIQDGRIKLYVTAMALRFRTEHANLFADGDYRAIEATGGKRDHVCAFSRYVADGDLDVVVVVPRLVHTLLKGEVTMPVGEAVWGDTGLPVAQGGRYRNVFTDGVVTADAEGMVRVADVLRAFPVALLERLDD